MMRSLYSGVAGLKTHQTRMDVIGNNIANVNTTAFKSSTINFSDLMSQTTQQASGPNATTGTGGTNARQIGLGVKSAAITMNIDGQGSAQSTGNPFDIMITGKNFFVVSNGLSNFFTRDGSFYVDGGGNLAMTSTGYNVMGWLPDTEDPTVVKKDTVQALRIMSDANMTYPPEATYKATVAGILDQNDTDVTSDAGKTVNLNFYDALGYSYTARLTLKDSDTKGSYSVELSKLLDSNGNVVSLNGASSPFFADGSVKDTTVVSLKTGYTWSGNTLSNTNVTPAEVIAALPITKDPTTETYSDEDLEKLAAIASAYGYQGSTEDFLKLATMDSTGAVSKTMEQLINNAELSTFTNSNVTTDTAGTKITFDGRTLDGITLDFNTNTGAFTGVSGSTATTAILNLKQLGGNFEDITIDFKDISMFNNNGTSTVAATSGDEKGIGSGRMLGDMIGVSIDKQGQIYASYDNGMTRLLGQIATAAFANNSGLSKEGDNLYSATMNSGEFDGIGVDVSASGGYMTTGVLEMSNVDLSNEFTTMITTQRGFQANSRIITVSDTLLEELTNLKR